MVSILLIEDDERVAELVKKGLEQTGDYSVTIVGDGKEGKHVALSHPFDLVITDIMLPSMNGTEVCQQIKEKRPDLPVIMLTALGTTDEKVEGFDAGADDYMVKPFEVRELTVRIRAVLKRFQDNLKFDNLLSFGSLTLDRSQKKVTREQQEIKLTPKEFNLLEYFLKHPNRVLTREEIAKKVWDTHFDTGTNFIDVYINYLRKKIDKPFSTPLIHTKPGMGFILSEDEN